MVHAIQLKDGNLLVVFITFVECVFCFIKAEQCIGCYYVM